MNAATSKAMAALAERFPVEEVKQRTQGGRQLDYISIDSTIRRLNDVLGTDWTTKPVEVSLTQAEGGNWLALVSLELEALGKSAIGVGADVAKDADKAIKTALAEAIKKAGHQYGVGLYLWDESERDLVAQTRANAATELRSLQTRVKEMYPGLSAAEIADELGITEAGLRELGALKAALAAAGKG